MPFGDRTGPVGVGPMTGRAMGYCAGFPVPGFMNPGYGFGRGFWFGAGFGRGLGRGLGFGRGRGWRRSGFWPFLGYPYWNFPYSPYAWFFTEEMEEDFLEGQAKILEEQLAQVNKRLTELRRKEKEKK